MVLGVAMATVFVQIVNYRIVIFTGQISLSVVLTKKREVKNAT